MTYPIVQQTYKPSADVYLVDEDHEVLGMTSHGEFRRAEHSRFVRSGGVAAGPEPLLIIIKEPGIAVGLVDDWGDEVMTLINPLSVDHGDAVRLPINGTWIPLDVKNTIQVANLATVNRISVRGQSGMVLEWRLKDGLDEAKIVFD